MISFLLGRFDHHQLIGAPDDPKELAAIFGVHRRVTSVHPIALAQGCSPFFGLSDDIRNSISPELFDLLTFIRMDSSRYEAHKSESNCTAEKKTPGSGDA